MFSVGAGPTCRDRSGRPAIRSCRRSTSSGRDCLTAAVFYEWPVIASIPLLSIAAGVPVYYRVNSAAHNRRTTRR
jgi:hypothetical protein